MQEAAEAYPAFLTSWFSLFLSLPIWSHLLYHRHRPGCQWNMTNTTGRFLTMLLTDPFTLWTLRVTDYGSLESRKMNKFGEPNMRNPSVRFDERREKSRTTVSPRDAP